jgi:hypothetical protein
MTEESQKVSIVAFAIMTDEPERLICSLKRTLSELKGIEICFSVARSSAGHDAPSIVCPLIPISRLTDFLDVYARYGPKETVDPGHGHRMNMMTCQRRRNLRLLRK